MKSKSFSISTTLLNKPVTMIHEIDLKIVYTKNVSGQTVSQIMYPKSLYMSNATNVDLEYVIISSEKEDTEFQLNKNNPGSYPFYDFIRFRKLEVVSLSGFGICYKFYLRRIASTAAAPFRVEFMHYVPKR